jgi:hypothetical protein
MNEQMDGWMDGWMDGRTDGENQPLVEDKQLVAYRNK